MKKILSLIMAMLMLFGIVADTGIMLASANAEESVATLYGKDKKLTVSVSNQTDRSLVLGLRLEMKELDKWEAVRDPENPSLSYKMVLTNPSEASFRLEGLPTANQYRVRVFSINGVAVAGRKADGVSVSYGEKSISLSKAEEPKEEKNAAANSEEASSQEAAVLPQESPQEQPLREETVAASEAPQALPEIAGSTEAATNEKVAVENNSEFEAIPENFEEDSNNASGEQAQPAPENVADPANSQAADAPGENAGSGNVNPENTEAQGNNPEDNAAAQGEESAPSAQSAETEEATENEETGEISETGEGTETIQPDMLRMLRSGTVGFTFKVKWFTGENVPTPEFELYKVKAGVEELVAAAPQPTHNANEDVISVGTQTQTYAYSGLPKQEDGQDIVYRVKQKKIAGFKSQPESVGMTGGEFINTAVFDFVFKIKWNDGGAVEGRPQPKFRVNDGNSDLATTIYLLKPILTNEWTFAVRDLVKFASDGLPFDYKIFQMDMDGYYIEPSVIEYHEGETFSFTNTKSTQFSFNKKWNDGNAADRPVPSFKLYQSVEGQVSLVSPQPRQPAAEENSGVFKYNYGKLPAFAADGKEITYHVVEDAAGMASYVKSKEQVLNNETLVNTLSKKFEFDVVWNGDGLAIHPEPTFTIKDNNGKVYDLQPEKVLEGNTIEKYAYKSLPAFDERGNPLEYRVSENKAGLEAYIISPESITDGGTIFNSTSENFEGYKKWGDRATYLTTRPSKEEWKNTLRLYRKTENPLSAGPELVTGWDYEIIEEGDDESKNFNWKILIKNVASFDPEGYAYTYTLDEGPQISKDASLGEYVNGHGMTTGTQSIKHHGILPSRISDKTGFQFTKRWIDEDAPEATRPRSKFYLYKFPDNISPEAGFKSFSPVAELNQKDLENYATEFNFIFATDDKLERYDPDGNRYVYYLYEQMENGGEYELVVDNSNRPAGYPDSAQFILPGGIAKNIRRVKINVPFTKTWIAKSLQSMNGGIKVVLERRLASQPGAAWDFVAEKTVEGFSVATLKMEDKFTAVDKFDDDGNIYQYRVREVAATIDTTAPYTDIVDNAFTSNEYPFAVETDENNNIINRLAQKTRYNVKKSWEPTAPAGNVTVTFALLRNGSANWDSSGLELENAAKAPGWSSSNAEFTMNGTGSLDMSFPQLPRFDENGAIYTYTIEEKGFTGADEYQHDITKYSVIGNEATAEMINVMPDGEGIRFKVKKEWIDGGDILQRFPVKVGLYRLEGGQWNPVIGPDGMHVVQTLSVSNLWRDYIRYRPSQTESQNSADYTVREISSDNFIVDTMDLQTGTGTAHTERFSYIVTTTRDNETIVVSNKRVAKVDIVINKNWLTNAYAAKNLTAVFEIYKNETELIQTARVSMNDPQGFELKGLDRFDDDGNVIHYSVKEVKVEGFDPSVNGVFDEKGIITINEYEKLISTREKLEHTYSTSYNQHDKIDVLYKNVLEGIGNYSIKKVWHDTDAYGDLRPDIKVKVYRYINSVQDKELVEVVPLWKTSGSGTNKWLWTADFGKLPIFDENGARYHYIVEEQYVQLDSFYHIKYHSQKDGTDSQPNPGGTSPKSTYAEIGQSSGYAYSNPDPNKTGVIINRLGWPTRHKINKYWRNIPSWFNKANLPPVYIQLWRATRDDHADAEPAAGTPIITLERGKGNHTFTGIPSLDYYGNTYRYFAKEVGPGGTVMDVPGYALDSTQNNSEIVNVYNPGYKKVEITAQKNWKNWLGLYALTDTYPAVTFKLHQVWTGGAISRDVVVNTLTIPSGLIKDWDANNSNVTFTTDAAGVVLPVFAPDSSEYTYYVEEVPVAGYTTEPATLKANADNWVDGGGIKTASVVFENTFAPQNEDTIQATKVWNDFSNKYLTRPAFNAANSPVTFKLKRKLAGTVDAGFEVMSNNWVQGAGADSDKWFITFNGQFPTYHINGGKYSYYVEETLQAPYDTTYKLSAGAGTLTLTNSLETVNVLLNKKWLNHAGQNLNPAALRYLKAIGGVPNSINFKVKVSDNNGASFQDPAEVIERKIAWPELLDAAINGTKLTIAENLPKYVPGQAIERHYKVEEDTTNVVGFEATYDPVQNTSTESYIENRIKTRTLYFVKDWDDENDRDGKRPTSISYTVTDLDNPNRVVTIILNKDSVSSDTADLAPFKPAANRWRADLFVPVNGRYSVEEQAVIADGYAKSAELNNGDRWSFTNKRDKKLISISASKMWSGDTLWHAMTRPASLEFALEYRKTGESAWKQLKDLSAAVDPQIPFGAAAKQTISPVSGNTWTNASWNDLPAYVAKSTDSDPTVAYEYRVVEVAVPKPYAVSYPTAPVSGLSAKASPEVNEYPIRNTLLRITISGSKTWADRSNQYGMRPSDLQLTVYADGVSMQPQPAIQWTKTGDVWTYTINSLPRYKDGQANPIVYSVKETALAGYSPDSDTSVNGTVAANGNVTQADFTNTLKTISISGSKTWANDQGNKFGTRPDNVVLKVFAGTREFVLKPDQISWVKAPGSDVWQYTIRHLPRYEKGSNTPISYKVVEEPSAGYELQDPSNAGLGIVSAADGNITDANFTNKLVTIDISGKKTWDDANNAGNVRPNSITVTVLRNGTPLVPQPDVDWSASVFADNDWPYTILGLPKYMPRTNVEAKYSVRETPVAGYIPLVAPIAEGNKDTNGNISDANFKNHVKVTISGKKTWVDASNRFTTRPSDINLTILANGAPLSPQPAIQWNKIGDEWTYSIDGLPRYSEGTTNEIVYTVKETAVAGYAPTTDTVVAGAKDGIGNISDADFTNTLITISIKGKKQWIDDSNKENTRPPEVVLTVIFGGTNPAITAQPDPADIIWVKTGDEWTYEIKNLPRYVPGTATAIVYSIRETKADGYDAAPDAQGNVDDATGNVEEANFVNELSPGITSVSGKKTWVDNSDALGLRPDQLQLLLQKTVGAVTSDVNISPDWQKNGDSWQYVYNNLPKYEDGILIIYSVSEIQPLGYTKLPDDPLKPFEFSNEYTAFATLQLQGSKTLSGRAMQADEFTFELYEGQDTNGTLLESVKNAAAAMDTAAAYSFAPIRYTRKDIGEKYYTVREVKGPADNGISYDETVYTVKVVIADGAQGVLDVSTSMADPANLNFANAYRASGGWSPKLAKKLNAGGRVLANEEFTFILKDQNGELLQTKKNDADGNIVFDKISYSEADIGKTYAYFVSEVAGSETNMVYDNAKKLMTVDISDAGNGKLHLVINNPANPVFTNSYTASGSWLPRFTKALNAGERLLQENEFSFEISSAHDGYTEIVRNKANGSVEFSAISYSEADIGKTYTYKVREIAGLEVGMSYDPIEMIVSVTVSDAGNGNLAIAVNYPPDTEFNNGYLASGSWKPALKKHLEAGGRILKADEFSFKITADHSAYTETVKNKADGSVVFAEIAYTQADIGKTYTYHVQELAGTENGMDYDASVIDITVSISDAGGGKLNVVPSYPADITFDNVYTASGDWAAALTKYLNAGGRVLENEEFSFELKDEHDTVLQTKKNDAAGNIVFDKIVYSQADIGNTYRYFVSEVAGGEINMVYDGAVKPITVAVSDAGNGRLQVDVDYPAGEAFTNSYTASATWTPSVKKELDAGTRLAKPGEFVFELKDKNGNILQTKTNDALNDVVFDAIHYSEQDIGKTYTYTVSEKAGSELGMSYDGSVKTFTVKVSDGRNGVLTLDISEPANKVFKNVYRAVTLFDIDAAIAPMKVLSGRRLGRGEFSFTLSMGTEVLQRVKNQKDGTIPFAPLKFTEADIGKSFTYIIKESLGDKESVIYDRMEIVFTIHVRDGGHGKLIFDVEKPEDVVFNNVFREPSGIINFNVGDCFE